MILAIDIGNTRTKLGWFQQGELQEVWTFASGELPARMDEWVQTRNPVDQFVVGWASVHQPDEPANWACWQHFLQAPTIQQISAQSPLPIINRYATPHTLGTDRIVAAIGAHAQVADRPVLVIDAGTALTYDFVSAAGEYLGGGISPGLRMRFRALHEFTARLPLAEPMPEPPLVGDSTSASIQSGVIIGMQSEVEGVIRRYQSHYGETLSVFLTGGDLPYFEKLGKNINFADSNLILRGIHFILTQQSSL